jgi:hypothetical protein
MTRRDAYDKLVAAIKADISGFEIRYKDESKLQQLIGKLMFWADYDSYVTAIYPVVWYPNRAWESRVLPVETLEHEWVHLKDQRTLFGTNALLPDYLNAVLFNLAYLFPQVLAVFALLAFINPLFLLFLVFLLPLPAPFRALAETRAYRRSIELGRHIPYIAESYVNGDYYWMWPWRARVMKDLKAPSPYKDEMDSYLD